MTILAVLKKNGPMAFKKPPITQNYGLYAKKGSSHWGYMYEAANIDASSSGLRVVANG